MNAVIEQLMKHRSIRKFKNEPISKTALDAIISAGQMASTSSNVQAYSVISIEDSVQREQFMKLSGHQAYITDCPTFLVWCADLYRLSKAANQHEENKHERNSQRTDHDSNEYYTDSVENLLVATVDTALAAQNAAVAAESLGLGVVYIGGVRNNIEQIAKVLKLPELVYPLFGMCIGVPDQSPMLRPRLPLDSVLHTNTYSTEQSYSGIEQYDKTSSAYLHARSNGKTNTPWSLQMRKRLKEPVRLHMKHFLQSRGFMKQ